MVSIPNLTLDELDGLKNYWRVYEVHREEIAAELLRLVRKHPEFKFILQNRPALQPDEEQNGSVELQRRAIFQGEWKRASVSRPGLKLWALFAGKCFPICSKHMENRHNVYYLS